MIHSFITQCTVSCILYCTVLCSPVWQHRNPTRTAAKRVITLVESNQPVIRSLRAVQVYEVYRVGKIMFWFHISKLRSDMHSCLVKITNTVRNVNWTWNINLFLLQFVQISKYLLVCHWWNIHSFWQHF